MLEDVGVFGAIERGHALTRNAFWRVLGIALLTAIITSIAGAMLGVPVTMVMDALLSGGLHHVQVPGQLPNVFKTVRMRIENLEISEYIAEITAKAGEEGFKKAVMKDLDRRRDTHAPEEKSFRAA